MQLLCNYCELSKREANTLASYYWQQEMFKRNVSKKPVVLESAVRVIKITVGSLRAR